MAKVQLRGALKVSWFLVLTSNLTVVIVSWKSNMLLTAAFGVALVAISLFVIGTLMGESKEDSGG
jgi:hypothetical protein